MIDDKKVEPITEVSDITPAAETKADASKTEAAK